MINIGKKECLALYLQKSFFFSFVCFFLSRYFLINPLAAPESEHQVPGFFNLYAPGSFSPADEYSVTRECI